MANGRSGSEPTGRLAAVLTDLDRLPQRVFDRSFPVWVVLFAGLVLLTHLGGLRREVINWDESTFMLMAQDILRGHLPYVSLFDNKPPGIFLLFAGAFALFGQSLLVARMVGFVSLFVLAVTSYGLARRFADRWASGLAVLAMISAASLSFGLFSSSELPATAFLALGLWAMTTHGQKFWSAPLVGVSLALATLVRSNLGIVVVGIGLIYLAAVFYRSWPLRRFGVVGYVLGGLVPLFGLIGVYAINGAVQDLVLGAFVVPLHFADSQLPMWKVLVSMALRILSGIAEAPLQMGVFIVLIVAGIVYAARTPAQGRAHAAGDRFDGLVVWAGTAALTLSVGLGGVFYHHYLLQFLPFGAVAAAIALNRGGGPYAWLATAGLAGALFATVPDTATVLFSPAKVQAEAGIRAAADAIAADRQPGDRVWALDAHLAHFYLDTPPVVAVAVHPGNLVRPAIAAPLMAAGYMHADELGYVMDLKPRYVVVRAAGLPDYLEAAGKKRVAALLSRDYVRWYDRRGILVYRRPRD